MLGPCLLLKEVNKTDIFVALVSNSEEFIRTLSLGLDWKFSAEFAVYLMPIYNLERARERGMENEIEIQIKK